MAFTRHTVHPGAAVQPPAVPPRASYRVLVRVAEENGSSQRPFMFCSSHDISISGVRLDAERPLAVGARLACSFFLPGSGQIDARGEIVRADTVAVDLHILGVRWLDLGPQETEAIGAYVQRQR